MKPLTPADFFCLRTPTLSWDVAARWSDGLESAGALTAGDDVGPAIARDARRLRERLRAIVARPEVRAALTHASSSLAERLPAWLAGDDSDASRSLEPVIVRYVLRMTGRPTPFGLFAGVSLGAIAGATGLAVPSASSHRRHTRLNVDVLFAIADGIARDPALRPKLRYRTNETAYVSGGRVRYYALRLKKTLRSYPLSEVPASSHVDVALGAAQGDGATIDAIAAAVVAAFDGVSHDEARAFVDGLVRAQLLQPTIRPPATGGEPLEHVIAALDEVPEARAIVDALRAVAEDLVRYDAAAYEDVAEIRARIVSRLRGLSPGLEASHLLKTDLRKTAAGATLARAVAEDIGEGVELLARLQPDDDESAVARFIARFTERYAEAEVPLLEALDGESGIGFDSAAPPGTDASPLLEKLALFDAPPEAVKWTKRDERLLARLTDALLAGADEIVLTDDDLAALATSKPAPLAPASNAIGSIAARSSAAIDCGEYRLHLHGGGGSPVGALFGRFLHDDPELDRAVRALLREEERHDPDALHAEVAHLPQALTSNVLSRPMLRAYEIEVAFGSGAPASARIPLSDLLVSVVGGRVRIRSRAHGKEVVPHSSSAHATRVGGLPAYRFLAAVNGCRFGTAPSWSWGALDDAPFLPRVVRGRHVLSLATWRIDGAELAAIASLDDTARFAAVQALRARRRLPRHVQLVEYDNALTVDLENVLAIDALLSACKKGAVATLREPFAAEGQLAARGPDGAFVHELIVPFVRRAERHERARLAIVTPLAPTPDRSKRPGDEWLYAKLHCGVATADRLLGSVIAPLVGALRDEGAIERWFFLRYGDPEWHVRLRLKGEPGALWSGVARRLFDALAESRGLVRRVALDTYDPETERYGGERALPIAEAIFEADSDAALAVIAHHRADPAARWQIALAGMDALLADLGFSLEERRVIVATSREGQAHRFSRRPELTHDLGKKYRAHRAEIDALLADPASRFPVAATAFACRSRAVAPLAARLRDLEAHGELVASRAEIASSLLHMWANRVFRGSANAQELVLYDFLHRAYASAIARRGEGHVARVAEGRS